MRYLTAVMLFAVLGVSAARGGSPAAPATETPAVDLSKVRAEFAAKDAAIANLKQQIADRDKRLSALVNSNAGKRSRTDAALIARLRSQLSAWQTWAGKVNAQTEALQATISGLRVDAKVKDARIGVLEAAAAEQAQDLKNLQAALVNAGGNAQGQATAAPGQLAGAAPPRIAQIDEGSLKRTLIGIAKEQIDDLNQGLRNPDGVVLNIGKNRLGQDLFAKFKGGSADFDLGNSKQSVRYPTEEKGACIKQSPDGSVQGIITGALFEMTDKTDNALSADDAATLMVFHHLPPAFMMFTWFALDYSLRDGAWQYDGCRVKISTGDNPFGAAPTDNGGDGRSRAVAPKNVTMTLADVDIRDAIRLILPDQEVEFDPDVKGAVSATIQDQPVDHALAQVLLGTGYTYSHENGAYHIKATVAAGTARGGE